MSTSPPEHPLAKSVDFADESLVIVLKDGREIRVPLEWYPSLRDASREQLEDFRLIGDGVGIHWPQLDEDLSIRGFLMPRTVLQEAG